MNNDYKQFLKSVRPATNYTDIKRLVAELQGKTLDENGREEEPGVEVEISEENEAKWAVLEESIDQMSDLLTKIQNSMDKQVLPRLKDDIGDSINSYITAYDATLVYNKEWFSRSYLSIDGKVELARFMIDIIQPYCKSNLETLKMIHNREPEIILFISWPRSDDS